MFEKPAFHHFNSNIFTLHLNVRTESEAFSTSVFILDCALVLILLVSAPRYLYLIVLLY